MLPLSILDLAFVPEGGTPADALRNTLDLAQHHKPIRVYNVLMMLEDFAQVVPVYHFTAGGSIPQRMFSKQQGWAAV